MREPGSIAPGLLRTLQTGNRLVTAERYRLGHNSLPIPPTMRAILDDALIHAKPVTQMEDDFGWPARSAKAIVGVLLDVLAEDGARIGTAPPPETHSARGLLDHLCATGFDHDIARHMDRWGLSIGEARVLEIMRRAPDMIISRDALMARMYPRNDDPPVPKIIDVRIASLRAKLAGSGVEIRTLYRVGWKLIWPLEAPKSPPDAPEVPSCDPIGTQDVTDDELLDYVAIPASAARAQTYMARFGLTGSEARLFEALRAAQGRYLSQAVLHQHLYQDMPGAAGPEGIKVFIMKIRRKVEPHGWRIRTHRGEGWELIPPAPAPDPPP